MSDKKTIRKVVKMKGKFNDIWKVIKDRDKVREKKQRLISKNGVSSLDRLNNILFEIQDDIKHAKKKGSAISSKQNELHNLLVMLDYFRSKSLHDQQTILDSLRV